MDGNEKLAHLKELAAKQAENAGLEKNIFKLKAMANVGAARKPEAPKAGEAAVEPPPQTIDEFMEKLSGKIVATRHYRTGRVDNYGKVLGIREFPEGAVPHVHQTHFLDSTGRPLKLEIYEQDFSRPVTRIYFYEGESDKISESVWFDRYGKIDNIHRYKFDLDTGLMTDRAEYNKEGQIFYQIHSEYNLSANPPLLIEDRWADKGGRQIQRLVYKHDHRGEVVIEERYNADDQLMGYHKIEYDEKVENPVKKEWFGPDNRLRSFFTYEYDESDNCIKAVLHDAEGLIEAVQHYTFDGIGSLKEEKWLDAEGKVFKHIKY